MLCVPDVAAGIPHLDYFQSSDEGYPGRRMFSAAHLSRRLLVGLPAIGVLDDWRNLG